MERCDHPSKSNRAKIFYMISYLKGTALDCFEPYLAGEPHTKPMWVNSFDKFLDELYMYFGPYDQQAEAEQELEKLAMHDNYKANRFLIKFYRLSALVEFNNNALRRKAYLALPKRIKDKMVHFDKPLTLDDLQNLAQKIDQCYWEQKLEQS